MLSCSQCYKLHCYKCMFSVLHVLSGTCYMLHVTSARQYSPSSRSAWWQHSIRGERSYFCTTDVTSWGGDSQCGGGDSVRIWPKWQTGTMNSQWREMVCGCVRCKSVVRYSIVAAICSSPQHLIPALGSRGWMYLLCSLDLLSSSRLVSSPDSQTLKRRWSKLNSDIYIRTFCCVFSNCLTG